jgi:hypothetical protein
MDALLPHLVQLKDFLAKNADEIERWGTIVGDDVGSLIDKVDAAMEGIYEGVHQNWEEISAEFDAIFSDWENAWKQSTESTAGIKKDFESIGLAIVHAMEDVARIVKASMEVAMDAYDLVHGNAAGTTQMNLQAKAAIGAAENAAGSGDTRGVDLAIAKYKQLATELGVNGVAVNRYADDIKANATAHQVAADQAKQSSMSGDFTAFDNYLNQAIDTQNDGSEKYAISIALESEKVRQHLIDGAGNIHGGLDALKKVIAEQSPELAKMLAEMLNPIKAQGGIKPVSLTQHFHGGVHIKQDFKDQDPERVAMVFRRDLAHAADARTGSLIRGVGGI